MRHAKGQTEILMTSNLTRRDFLTMAAGASALDLAGGSAAVESQTPGSAAAATPAALIHPSEAPFDTVVVLMMENRSFDHVLGWLPGANGRQQGLRYADKNGFAHQTWPLAPEWQGCQFSDPDHSWQGAAIQYAGGRCDGFLQTAPLGDRFPIGYYGEKDLPILSALAAGYTTFDNYFCSMQGPTWENRMYQLSGTTQVDLPGDFPQTDADRPCDISTTIFDRVTAAGLRAAYYYHGEPVTGLFKSKRYDGLSHSIEQFWVDARNGSLANVVFVDPDYTNAAEDNGTSNDYHPKGSVLVAEQFVARVHNALKTGPQWERMVFVLNFDEHGGFFDHVPPPSCRDDTVQIGPGPFPDLKRLGFRVPAIAMGPFAPRKIESAGPYEHCSILRMIEWRWGLEPMRMRDRYAKNLADALDFKARRAPVVLPEFTAPAPLMC
jgi:phospholipase C